MIKFTSPIQRRTFLILSSLLVVGGLVYLGVTRQKPADDTVKAETASIPVRVQKASESFESTEIVTYPGMIQAENEATIIAKTNGTAANIAFQVGDRVEIGQELIKIDDVNSNGASASQSGLNADQVKQAELAVQQAMTSLQLARNNEATLLLSSNRDLQQAQITANQSSSAQQNLQKTTEESLKAAQSNYETAKIATEQARLALENRQKMSDQSSQDVKTNADTTMANAADACASVISTINTLTGVEVSSGGIVAYRDLLGRLDATSSEKAHQSYVAAVAALKTYRSGTYADQASRLSAVTLLTQATKKLTDDTKYMLDKTSVTADFSQATLSSIQAQVIGFQTQANGLQSQLDQVNQALTNTGLTNSSTLDALQKAYEIAQQQEQTAAQSIENLKAGNTTQTDQVTFSVQSAQNQLEATKTRVNGQISSMKSQVDLAQIQYQNAVIALQNISDAHHVISPIAGVIVKKNVSNGDTISQGQTLAVVGTPDQLKIAFFIDQESLNMVSPGLEVRVSSPDGNSASGTVVSISPQADATTHRYEVEVRPILTEGVHFPLGSIVDVSLPLRKIASQGNILVPLSSIDVTPNGSFLTIVQDEKAERIQIDIKRILGEMVEIQAPITPETVIVVDGNRLTSSGSPVTIIQ